MFFQLGTQDMLARTFATAGYAQIASERLASVLEYASGDDACGAAFAGGPVALAYSRFDGPTRAGAHAEYLASLEPYRGGSSYQVPGEFVIAVGYKP